MDKLPLAYLNPLTDCFQELHKVYLDMTVNQALVFTTVAANPGINLKTVEHLTGLSDSSVSRICHIFGDKGNRKTEPLHLFRSQVSPHDSRVLDIFLTARGNLIAQSLANHIRGVRR